MKPQSKPLHIVAKKDDISEEVKEAIFEYLEMYNIPMTSRNFNIVLNEYTKNRLYLARR